MSLRLQLAIKKRSQGIGVKEDHNNVFQSIISLNMLLSLIFMCKNNEWHIFNLFAVSAIHLVI